MAFALDPYTAGAAQVDYTITFSYRKEVDVLVFEDGALQTQGANNDYTFFNATTIRFTTAHAGGELITIQRSTSQSTRLVNYTAGALAEADLDNDSLHAFRMAQESIDIANIKLGLTVGQDVWDAESKRITLVSDGTGDQDVVTKAQLDAAALVQLGGGPLGIANGGTGSDTAAAARTALGLGTSAVIDTGTSGTKIPLLDGANTWSGAQIFNGLLTLGTSIAMVDNIVSRAILIDYAEIQNSIGATGGGTQDIDIELGNVVSATVDTSANTFTFSNPSVSGRGCSFTLILTNGGSQTVTWPATVDWSGGNAPTLTTSGRDVLTFVTLDAGTIWYGFISSLDAK